VRNSWALAFLFGCAGGGGTSGATLAIPEPCRGRAFQWWPHLRLGAGL